MRLNKRQLRRLIMEEMMNSSKYPVVKNRRPLNEGIGMTIAAGAAILIGAPVLAVTAFMAYVMSDNAGEDEEGNQLYRSSTRITRADIEGYGGPGYDEYEPYREKDIPKITEKIKSDPTLKSAAAEVGQRVLSGEDAMQAAKDVIQSDAAVAQTLKDCCVDPAMLPRSSRSEFDIDGIDF